LPVLDALLNESAAIAPIRLLKWRTGNLSPFAISCSGGKSRAVINITLRKAERVGVIIRKTAGPVASFAGQYDIIHLHIGGMLTTRLLV